MDSVSFESFNKAFRSKVTDVEDTVQLRDAGHDDCCVKELNRLDHIVQEVQDGLKRCHTEMTASSAEINRMKAMIKILDHFETRLKHMRNNIPERMPKPCREVVSQSVSPKTEVRGSAITRSETATDKKQEKQPTSCPPAKDNGKSKPKTNIYLPEIEFLSVPEFGSVPKYLKGRLTYDQVNKFVEGFNKAYEAKYKLLKKKPSTMNLPTRQKFDAYKMQETKDTKGLYFIVEEDLKTLGGLKVDNVTRSVIPILRHIGRLREVRGGRITRYVYVDSY